MDKYGMTQEEFDKYYLDIAISYSEFEWERMLDKSNDRAMHPNPNYDLWKEGFISLAWYTVVLTLTYFVVRSLL